jgi:hypothetical protein
MKMPKNKDWVHSVMLVYNFLIAWYTKGEERWVQHLVGNPKEKTPFGRPRSRWEGSIKIDVEEGGGGGQD